MGHQEPKVYISDKLPDSLRKSMKLFQVKVQFSNLNLRNNWTDSFFQAKNELPVFLKGGPADKVLYLTTVALCGVGILGIVRVIYTMGFAKKKAD